ncbi:unnamed protein product, partial [Rotaria magnacalcarata]
MEWPIVRQKIRRMCMSKDHKLIEQKPLMTNLNENKVSNNVNILEYRPWIGFEAG